MPIKNINGTMLHFRKMGEGTPIVFIHPPLLTSANFRYQQVQLSDEFQVITFDIRGHGQSGKSDAPITYKLIVEDIKQLLDHLNIEKAVVCGYSTGGAVALEAILTYPDRFSGGVLISAMSEASDFILRNRIRIASGLSKWKIAIRMLMLGITWGNSDNIPTFRKLLNDSKSGDNRNIHQYYRYSLNYNCTKQLSRIKAPVLLLYGDKDRGFKRYSRKLQKGLRNCKLVTFRKEKHQLPTKAAVEMNEAMRAWIHQSIQDKRDNLEAGYPIPEAYILDKIQMEDLASKSTDK
ncbi:alpha/beta hydrolase [Paenibacillus alkaliterrae]|uniref:alpha/beta fold hydrolase n=1 Tax=Paenibacillus alkaliterrae TaxID=320909 RepID=UPI001F358429|nr:alpha/beta hydrolase [Paenibacillus alkaliterrae]MCF2937820.1 alpha/beta hydrolase [Paenibacillus alkaliterrae]